MADPVTLAAISIGSTVAGGVVGGIGAQQSAGAQASAYQYKAGVALLNKQINEQNARWTLDAGEGKATEYGLKAKEAIGQTKVTQAASGLDVNSGSNAQVRQTQTDVAAYDQNVIRSDAAKTAWGYETKATTDLAESKLDMMASDQAKTAGNFAMATSFLSAGANVSSKWLQGSQIGIGSSSSGAMSGSSFLDAAAAGAL